MIYTVYIKYLTSESINVLSIYVIYISFILDAAVILIWITSNIFFKRNGARLYTHTNKFASIYTIWGCISEQMHEVKQSSSSAYVLWCVIAYNTMYADHLTPTPESKNRQQHTVLSAYLPLTHTNL